MSTRILIVDDEPNLLRLIGYALEIEGYQVVVAQSGAEALSKVQAEQPDLMILDVMLPDMSGIEVCQQVRSKPEMINLPVIMLSARAQVPDKIAGLKAGADEYVTKPIDSDEMVARVAALLKRTDRLRHMQPSKCGKVVGFIGAKGGVGTTTVTLNVASVLARQKSVVAVELRSCYGTFGPQLGCNVGANLGDLLELDPERIDERTLSRALVNLPSGLGVLFGPQKADEFRDI
jgi:pilus assembly protein CpaE